MKKILGIIILVLALGLVGCGSSTTENTNTEPVKTSTEDKVENKVEDKTENQEQAKVENKTENKEEAKVENKVEDKKNVGISIQNISRKEEYRTKLNNIELGLKDLEEKESSGVTADMREAASERYKRWDAALNEIYGVLKGQLSSNDMKKLQSEEIKWIAYRDAKAKEASSEMKGGTMESVLYVSSLAETTKNRCYELVEKYMK